MTPSELRAIVGEWTLACEWPGCGNTGPWELAHLESTGMGGRRSAHTLDNVMRACRDHARITDQALPNGWNLTRYRAELDKLGVGSAFELRETLAEHLRGTRSMWHIG